MRDEASGTLYAHTESRTGLTTTGQYTVQLPDGRIQTVKYTADQGGYRATVSYDGVAHHPDKIIAAKSRAVMNYPPVKLLPLVPTVGGNAIPVVPPNGFPTKLTEPAIPRPQVVHMDSFGEVPVITAPVVPAKPTYSSHENTVVSRPLRPSPPKPVPVVPQGFHGDQNPSAGTQAPQPQFGTGNVGLPPQGANLPSGPPVPVVPFSSPSVHRNQRLPLVSFVQTSLGKLPVVPPNNYVANVDDRQPNTIFRVPGNALVRPRSRTPPQNTFIPTDVHPSLIEQSNPQHNSPSLGNSPQQRHSPEVTGSSSPIVSSQLNDEITIKSFSQLTPPYQDASKKPSMSLLTNLNPPYFSSETKEDDCSRRVVLASDLQQADQVSLSGKSELFAEKGSDFISNSIEQSITESFRPEDNFDVYPSRTSSKDLEQAEKNSLEGSKPLSRPNPFLKPSLDFSPDFHPSQGIAIKTASGFSFIVNPNASVFHNNPSIIIDYSHRGASSEEDSVPLTAPYVFVGGAYSPNPQLGSPSGDDNRSIPGIAPIDAADAGNVRLAPESLPPHLARLQEDREEIRTKPFPVKLKLADRENHGHLPLRDKPSTFGSAHTDFTPNSLGKDARPKRSPVEVSGLSNEDSAVGQRRKLFERIVSRPIIRNG